MRRALQRYYHYLHLVSIASRLLIPPCAFANHHHHTTRPQAYACDSGHPLSTQTRLLRLPNPGIRTSLGTHSLLYVDPTSFIHPSIAIHIAPTRTSLYLPT
ncbi:hypothetical protein F4808DRAFT_103881 [Astrocystis sublimbata]|nr:hypothetical protein F4808DRAFT_103881 [Astrocystis sublimbata]